jgi:HK97 family phage prohead protease
MRAAPVIDFRSSDETLDRYNEVIVAGGWKLANYQKNPVVQNAHRYESVLDTIGKSTVTEVRGDHLFQRVEFAVNENPIAKITYGLYKGGFLSAVSVGFIPKRWENGSQEAGYRRKYIEQELLEVSAVGIPANPNALKLGFEAGAVEKAI